MPEKSEDLLKGLSLDPCAIVFESERDILQVVDEARQLSKSKEVIIAVREGKELEKRLLPAYLNAYLRSKEDAMHSGSISLETILFLAGNMNITNAVEKV